MRQALAAATIAALMAAGPASAFDCHTSLILALDTSESVDAAEAALQRAGLAFALTDPAVMEALAPNPDYGTFALVFEWAGVGEQQVIAGWARLDGEPAIRSFADGLSQRALNRSDGQTAVGDAMAFAARAFGDAPQSCTRRVIDVSGDGPGNIGPSPGDFRARGLFDGLIVNGLVIRAAGPLYLEQQPSRDPLPYYESEVRQGPGSFVMTTNTYEDYGMTMQRKLLRELRPSVAEAGR